MDHRKSSAVLNLTSLKDEYAGIISDDIVADVYLACDKDCDRSRAELDAMCGRKRPKVEDIEEDGFELREYVGNLFESPQDSSLAHCVSECLAMGKGIAVEFKKRFGSVDALKHQNAKIGTCAVLKRGERYIYYLVTKPRYYNKPALANLKLSLVWMRDHAIANKVSAISMPRIGCGLDGLNWEAEVKPALVDVFRGTQIRIAVFRL